MKLTIPRKKSGSVLVILMSILVAFSLMAAALIKASSFNELETIQQLHTTQAHWLAEAGLEKELSQIIASRDYRESIRSTPSLELDEDFPEMPGFHYRVWASKDGVEGSTESAYKIVSTGEVQGGTAAVSIDMTCISGSDYALMGLSGDSEIHDKSNIDGSLYQEEGKLSIKNDVKLTGLVETVTGVTLDIKPNNITTVEVDPVRLPPMDRTPYTTLINYADNKTNSTVIQGNKTYDGPINLNGATVYVNGDISIKNDITGGGTFVASGKINLKHTPSTVAPDVTFVAKDKIIFNHATTLGENTEVFSTSDIIIKEGGLTATNTIFLAMETVEINAKASFSGIIYAENKIKIHNASDIQGILIARQGIDLAEGTTIRYDRSVFSEQNPINWGDQLLITAQKWTESRQ